MGYIRHDAIIVTSWNSVAIEAAAKFAVDLGLHVLGPGAEVTNCHRTMLVCPDGSKEGWEESNKHDIKRAEFLRYLNDERYGDNSSCLHWVALSYSDDDRDAKITAHTWQVPLKP